MKTDATVIQYLFRPVPELSPVLHQTVCNGNPPKKKTMKRWRISAFHVKVPLPRDEGFWALFDRMRLSKSN